MSVQSAWTFETYWDDFLSSGLWSLGAESPEWGGQAVDGEGQDLHMQKSYPSRPETALLGKPACHVGVREPRFPEGAPIPGSWASMFVMLGGGFPSGGRDCAVCWTEGAGLRDQCPTTTWGRVSDLLPWWGLAPGPPRTPDST